MEQDSLLPFELPAVARKKVSVAFDGGQMSSDAGVLLLREVERRLGIAARLAECLIDRRDPDRISHRLEEMLRLRMFAIAAGYEDADDCDDACATTRCSRWRWVGRRRAASRCARSRRCRGWRTRRAGSRSRG